LRTMGREAPRDTTPADSVQVRLRRLREDSVRLVRQAAAPADLPRDSIMQALAQLIGFQATQYKGTAALFNADSGVLVLRATPEEKAVVIQGAQSLAADSLITYNRNTTVACGRGKPVLVGEGAEAPVESAFVCYNTRDKIGTAIGATTQVSEGANWHVTADLYTKENDLYGHHARFTDCNLEVPHYHFSAGSMKVVNGDVMVARNVTLNFGDVPVFWLPFLMQSLKQGRRSGILMPEFSVNDIVRRNSRYNRRVRNVGFYWAASDNLGAQVALDWYASNWTGLEGAFDYNFAEQFLNGGATVRHFWQNGGRRDFTIAANNSWQPSERTDLRANVQYSTSSDFIRRSSFDPRELNRSIDSNGGMQRRFDWGSINLGVQRRQHLSNNKVDMTLPSLSLNLNPVTLFPASGEGGWFNNITWTGNGGARFTSADIDPAMDPALTDRREVTANASTSLNVGRLSLSSNVDYRDARRDPRPAVGDTADDDFLPAEPGQREERAGWSANLSFQQRLIGTSTFTPGVSMRREFVRDSLTGQMISSPMRLDLNAALKTDLFGFWPGVGPLERI
ncbi:MAG TPA: putative LPS assembly protein LptD, partial [Longimicrobiales bacterium]|nr:putative LPS assembly protein LptD [Longimicrobiales bacterium]